MQKVTGACLIPTPVFFLLRRRGVGRQRAGQRVYRESVPRPHDLELGQQTRRVEYPPEGLVDDLLDSHGPVAKLVPGFAVVSCEEEREGGREVGDGSRGKAGKTKSVYK